MIVIAQPTTSGGYAANTTNRQDPNPGGNEGRPSIPSRERGLDLAQRDPLVELREAVSKDSFEAKLQAIAAAEPNLKSQLASAFTNQIFAIIFPDTDLESIESAKHKDVFRRFHQGKYPNPTDAQKYFILKDFLAGNSTEGEKTYKYFLEVLVPALIDPSQLRKLKTAYQPEAITEPAATTPAKRKSPYVPPKRPPTVESAPEQPSRATNPPVTPETRFRLQNLHGKASQPRTRKKPAVPAAAATVKTRKPLHVPPERPTEIAATVEPAPEQPSRATITTATAEKASLPQNPLLSQPNYMKSIWAQIDNCPETEALNQAAKLAIEIMKSNDPALNTDEITVDKNLDPVAKLEELKSKAEPLSNQEKFNYIFCYLLKNRNLSGEANILRALAKKPLETRSARFFETFLSWIYNPESRIAALGFVIAGTTNTEVDLAPSPKLKNLFERVLSRDQWQRFNKSEEEVQGMQAKDKQSINSQAATLINRIRESTESKLWSLTDSNGDELNLVDLTKESAPRELTREQRLFLLRQYFTKLTGILIKEEGQKGGRKIKDAESRFNPEQATYEYCKYILSLILDDEFRVARIDKKTAVGTELIRQRARAIESDPQRFAETFKGNARIRRRIDLDDSLQRGIHRKGRPSAEESGYQLPIEERALGFLRLPEQHGSASSGGVSSKAKPLIKLDSDQANLDRLFRNALLTSPVEDSYPGGEPEESFFNWLKSNFDCSKIRDEDLKARVKIACSQVPRRAPKAQEELEMVL